MHHDIRESEKRQQNKKEKSAFKIRMKLLAIPGEFSPNGSIHVREGHKMKSTQNHICAEMRTHLRRLAKAVKRATTGERTGLDVWSRRRQRRRRARRVQRAICGGRGQTPIRQDSHMQVRKNEILILRNKI
jgi:hypothetical protein